MKNQFRYIQRQKTSSPSGDLTVNDTAECIIIKGLEIMNDAQNPKEETITNFKVSSLTLPEMNTAWLISKSGHTAITIHGSIPVIKTLINQTFDNNGKPHVTFDTSPYGKGYVDVHVQTASYYLSKTTYQDILLYVHQDYAPDPLELIFNKYNEPKGWRLTRRKP